MLLNSITIQIFLQIGDAQERAEIEEGLQRLRANKASEFNMLSFGLNPDEDEVALDEESEKNTLITIIETEKEEANSESFLSKRSYY